MLRSQFGIPTATIWRACDEISVILSRMSHINIRFPDSQEFENLMNGMRSLDTLYGAILAIDGCHIKINRPKTNFMSYYNKYQYFSICLVVASDYRKMIRSVSYQCGSWHDAGVYRNSEMRIIIDQIGRHGAFVIGDPAFGGFDNIRTTNSTISRQITTTESQALGRQRVLVENCFALLKERFKILSYKISNKSVRKNLRIIKSCIFLHNFIIENE